MGSNPTISTKEGRKQGMEVLCLRPFPCCGKRQKNGGVYEQAGKKEKQQRGKDKADAAAAEGTGEKTGGKGKEMRENGTDEDAMSERRTRELYYEDGYQTQFSARVLSCKEERDGDFSVILDQTAFFPEQGGQGADRGVLGGRSVLDVQVQDGVITHHLDGALPMGDTVAGTVDWERRYDFMQQHTGEHIVSGLVHHHFGYDNVGFHLSEEETRLDFSGPIGEQDLLRVEEEANRAVWSNLPVLVSCPEPAQLSTLSYRSKLELKKNVRIVEIPGVDRCACCAPHVRSTAEVGIIKLTGAMNYKGGVRLTMVCGLRALKDYRNKQSCGEQISRLLSVRQGEITEGVRALQERLQVAESENQRLSEMLLERQAASVPGPECRRHALLFVESAPQGAMRRLVNTWAGQYRGLAAIFSGNDAQGYRFILGSRTVDCTALAEVLRAQGFRCGGGKGYLQGSAPGSEAKIRAILEEH